MEDYQQRVIDEKKELNEKIMKLVAFLANPALLSRLTKGELRRLERQFVIMESYRDILNERILAFT